MTDEDKALVERVAMLPDGNAWPSTVELLCDLRDRIEAQAAEIEKLEALAARDERIAELENLAKANNDLARIEAAYRKQLAFQRAEMANALEAVTSQYGDRLPAQFLADITAMLMRPALRSVALKEKNDVA